MQERGFIGQLTHEAEIRKLLAEEKVTFYIGFDPTADSLHVGHFIQIMVMAIMQQYGHRPIALIGGGTTMVGDPSGRTDMRKMLSLEEINSNGEKFKKVFEKFLDFSEGKAIMVNNADWLLSLNYVDFARYRNLFFGKPHVDGGLLQKQNGKRTFLFRIQLYDYAILRLFNALSKIWLYDAIWRQ